MGRRKHLCFYDNITLVRPPHEGRRPPSAAATTRNGRRFAHAVAARARTRHVGDAPPCADQGRLGAGDPLRNRSDDALVSNPAAPTRGVARGVCARLPRRASADGPRRADQAHRPTLTVDARRPLRDDRARQPGWQRPRAAASGCRHERTRVVPSLPRLLVDQPRRHPARSASMRGRLSRRGAPALRPGACPREHAAECRRSVRWGEGAEVPGHRITCVVNTLIGPTKAERRAFGEAT